VPLLLSARASLFSRCFTLCMLLTRAPHVLCAQQHSELFSGRSVPLIMTILKPTSAAHLIARWMQKERAQSFGVRSKNQIKPVPSVAFICLVGHGNRSHRSPTLVHVAAELPSLQRVRDWLSTRCYGR
jgi:hypothetical protein